MKEEKYSTTTILRWFYGIFRQVKLQAFINSVSGVLRVALDLAFIWATKTAIDIATAPPAVEPSSSFWHTGPTTLAQAACILIFIMFCQLSLGYAGRWIAALLGVGAQKRMQARIFSHLLRSRWQGIEVRHSGDTLNRLVSDCGTVVSVITNTIPQALAVGVRLVAAFFFLFAMDSTIALVTIFVIPGFILLSRVYINKMRELTRVMRQTDSRIQAIMQESIQHRMVLKTLERIQMMTDFLEAQQLVLRRQVRHRTMFSSTSNLILNIGFGAVYMFTFIWSAYQLADGVITFGMMTAFIQLCGQIQGPFREMTRFIPTIIGSFTAAERLMELEEAPLEAEGSPLYFRCGAGIRFTDVCFAYDKAKRPILKDLNVDFPPGSVTAVLGETGAGKTTLIRLILALLSPNSGKVEIYGPGNSGNPSADADSISANEAACGHCVSDIQSVGPQTRCNLVYVPQGNTLFSGTLRWNLQLGRSDATDEDMRNALRLACADFVASLSDGLDTVIGEGGAGLSEGQAQRIAIARALLRQGSILLLDEATSALDENTERRLLENLVNHFNSQSVSPTLIFVTHRKAVVEHCTQVITLKKLDGKTSS
ncbi:MAG: ABC transporter ATP-binding protein/permease [Bacteroidaceae bacterium]|nr:ABC transporter ATP-binding protein/permease [Bacteroidaceae bacterium]